MNTSVNTTPEDGDAGASEANAMLYKTVLSEIEQRWNAAAQTWDIKALAGIYSDNALFFGLLPKLYIGRPEIEQYFGSYTDVLEGVTLSLFDQSIRALGNGMFMAQGFGNIVNRRQDGTVVENTVRSSFVVVENRKEWEIALHHFSNMPV